LDYSFSITIHDSAAVYSYAFSLPSENQWGCNADYPYGCTEPNSELEALVSSLTAGPVGPSDKLEMLNVTRIMQTCRGDGLLLKPDRPAYPHHLTFINQFAQNVTWLDDLWYSFSSFGAGTWHYLLAANLTSPYSLSPDSIYFTAEQGYVYDYHQVFSTFNQTGDINPSELMPFNNESLIYLKESGDLSETINFEYLIVAPVLNNSWTLLGELGKHIPVSKQRFAEITVSTNGLLLGIVGGASETVNVGLVPPPASSSSSVASAPPSSAAPFVFSCTLNSIGEAKIVCSSGKAVCACLTE